MRIVSNNGFIAQLPEVLLALITQEWLIFADSDLLRMALLNEEDGSNLVKLSFDAYHFYDDFSAKFALAIYNQSEFLTRVELSSFLETTKSESFREKYHHEVFFANAWIIFGLLSEETKNLICYNFCSPSITEQYFYELFRLMHCLIKFAKTIKINAKAKLPYLLMLKLSQSFPNIQRVDSEIKRDKELQALIDRKINETPLIGEQQDIAIAYWNSRRIKKQLFSADVYEEKQLLEKLQALLLKDLSQENLTEEGKIWLRYGFNSELIQYVVAANNIVNDQTSQLDDLMSYAVSQDRKNTHNHLPSMRHENFCSSVYLLISLYQNKFGIENFIFPYIYSFCVEADMVYSCFDLISYCQDAEEHKYKDVLFYLSILLKEIQLISRKGSGGVNILLRHVYSYLYTRRTREASIMRICYISIMQQVLDAGADPNCLEVADVGKNIRDLEILRMLFKAGLKANLSNQYENPSLLSQYIRRFDLGDQFELEDVQSLITYDVVNLKDDEKMTPLHILLYSYANFFDHLEFASFDVDVPAHCLKYFNILKLLLEAHAEVTGDDLKHVPRVSDDASVEENTNARFFEQRDSGFYHDNMFPLLWQAHVYSVDVELKNAVTYQS